MDEKKIEKFVVLSETGVSLLGSDTVYPKGDVLEMYADAEQTIALVANGSIAAVTEYTDDQMEDFVVTEEFLTENPLMASEGDIKVGDTIRVPKVEAPVPAEETVASDEAPVPAEKVMTYANKKVIRNGIREVNGIEVHEVTLEDGSTLDITDEEFEKMVETAG